METERELLEAIRHGDRAALRRLYDRYSGYAMAVGLRYVPERDSVRDVLQDSFVRILTSIGSFSYRGEGSLRAWVTRIVSNTAIDHLRRQQPMLFLDVAYDVADDNGPDPQPEGVPPDVLTRMIGQLPPQQRAVLNLFVFEQQSHRQIGQQLGIKEKTSATIFFRAKKMLGRMIKEYLNEQDV